MSKNKPVCDGQIQQQFCFFCQMFSLEDNYSKTTHPPRGVHNQLMKHVTAGDFFFFASHSFNWGFRSVLGPIL
jgi:hypothetical protein